MEFEFRGHPCAYCRQEIAGEPTSCRRCSALYHPDCWAANRSRCAIYGCEPAVVPAAPAAPPPAPARETASAPRFSLPWAVWIIVFLPLFHLLRESNLTRPPTPPLKAVDSERIRLLRQSISNLPPAVPAAAGEVDELMEWARSLCDRVAPTVEKIGRRERIPESTAERDELRREIASAAAVLVQARHLYQRCAGFQETAFLRTRIDDLSGTITRLEGLKSTLDRLPERR